MKKPGVAALREREEFTLATTNDMHAVSKKVSVTAALWEHSALD